MYSIIEYIDSRINNLDPIELIYNSYITYGSTSQAYENFLIVHQSKGGMVGNR